MRLRIWLALTVLLGWYSFSVVALDTPGSAESYARDPAQAIDQGYTDKIREYTTDPSFNSPLTDYLPASSTVPTPDKVLGHIAGAPNYLPYSADVYRYFRALAAASPRVEVFTIGKTEEGREMIAVAVASEALIAKLEENSAKLAKLADPRVINMDDAQAEPLINTATPIYYITGTIHSPETGSPTALMELAYRLAVDEHQHQAGRAPDHVRCTRVLGLSSAVIGPDLRQQLRAQAKSC